MSSHDSRESRFGDQPADAGDVLPTGDERSSETSPTSVSPHFRAPNADPTAKSDLPNPFGDESLPERFTQEAYEEDLANRPSRWDENDPRRQADCFAPPKESCECYCLHCGRTFSSDGIWFQQVKNDPQGFKGFWMCPTPNCSGAGFTFDIFPTDQAHPANEGWHDDEETDDEPEDHFDDDETDWIDPVDSVDEPEEYDPEEPKYREIEDLFGGDSDDDLEGEEWKFGLQPGERPTNPVAEEAESEWRREQQMYDEPDQRPRTLDWSDRVERREENRRDKLGDETGFLDDDIPF